MSTYKKKKVYFDGKEYILGDKLGAGGNGYVCLARTPDEHVQYAVKFLTVDKDSENYEKKVERFSNELKFCMEAEHENILKVYAQSVFNDKPCYLMPLCYQTLKNKIADEKNMTKLLRYVIQLCEAIKYIHNKGIIHRDIKPENIFFDKDDNLILGDFGIAHFIDSTMTNANDWLGNKSYAAPEQVIKGQADKVTTACDIYALGAIINELFTGQKPSGSRYVTISEKEPLLFPLDNIVYRCMMQDPDERPRIEEVLTEVKLLWGEIESNLDDIRDVFFDFIPLESQYYINILDDVCEDILIAKNIFENSGDSSLDRYNTNYHVHIRYNVSAHIKKLYFQKLLNNVCADKFFYEANVYSRGDQYKPLNLDDNHEFGLYKQFEAIVKKYSTCKDIRDMAGKSLKLFSSCCNYHCEEILGSIQHIEEMTENLDDSPILYIVYQLKKELPRDIVKSIDFCDCIEVNWKTTVADTFDCECLYRISEDEERTIVIKFEETWNVLCSKIDSKHYSVIFPQKDDFIKFREYALTLSEPYFVFRGDVLSAIRIKREYDGIIELDPWDTFDVTNVLAKILGFRIDY